MTTDDRNASFYSFWRRSLAAVAEGRAATATNAAPEALAAAGTTFADAAPCVPFFQSQAAGGSSQATPQPQAKKRKTTEGTGNAVATPAATPPMVPVATQPPPPPAAAATDEAAGTRVSGPVRAAASGRLDDKNTRDDETASETSPIENDIGAWHLATEQQRAKMPPSASDHAKDTTMARQLHRPPREQTAERELAEKTKLLEEERQRNRDLEERVRQIPSISGGLSELLRDQDPRALAASTDQIVREARLLAVKTEFTLKQEREKFRDLEKQLRNVESENGRLQQQVAAEIRLWTEEREKNRVIDKQLKEELGKNRGLEDQLAAEHKKSSGLEEKLMEEQKRATA